MGLRRLVLVLVMVAVVIQVVQVVTRGRRCGLAIQLLLRIREIYSRAIRMRNQLG